MSSVFTLDQNAGLVVDRKALVDSKIMEKQFEAARLLAERSMDWREKNYYPCLLPCCVCGSTFMTGIEPRFDYVVCEKHSKIPPNQIHHYRNQQKVTRQELKGLIAGLDHMGLATCAAAANFLRQIADAQPKAWLHRQGDYIEASGRKLDEAETNRGWMQQSLYTLPLED